MNYAPSYPQYPQKSTGYSSEKLMVTERMYVLFRNYKIYNIKTIYTYGEDLID